MMSLNRQATTDIPPRASRSEPLAAAAILLLALAPAPALAQDPANLPGTEGSTLPWVVFAAILVVGCLTGFIKSKRSHQH